jgi:hypothetical protein
MIWKTSEKRMKQKYKTQSEMIQDGNWNTATDLLTSMIQGL